MGAQSLTSPDEILLEILDPKHKSDYDPAFNIHYHIDHDSPKQKKTLAHRFIQEVSDDLDLARFNPVGKKILDAGCGWGIETILMHIKGAAETHGIDMYEPVINNFRKYLSFFPKMQGIYPKIANASNTGYPDAYFDFIFSNESISHYLDPTSFLLESFRILKPGGILFISDGNNGANPYIVWQTRKIWERFEKGLSENATNSKSINISYQDRRKEIILETFENIPDDIAAALAKGSFGYTRDQIIQACQNYLNSGLLPSSYFQFGVVPVNPSRDMFQERLIYPANLSRQLGEIGFLSKVYAHVGGAGGNPIIRMANKAVELLSPITWPVGLVLKVVARKP